MAVACGGGAASAAVSLAQLQSAPSSAVRSCQPIGSSVYLTPRGKIRWCKPSAPLSIPCRQHQRRVFSSAVQSGTKTRSHVPISVRKGGAQPLPRTTSPSDSGLTVCDSPLLFLASSPPLSSHLRSGVSASALSPRSQRSAASSLRFHYNSSHPFSKRGQQRTTALSSFWHYDSGQYLAFAPPSDYYRSCFSVHGGRRLSSPSLSASSHSLLSHHCNHPKSLHVSRVSSSRLQGIILRASLSDPSLPQLSPSPGSFLARPLRSDFFSLASFSSKENQGKSAEEVLSPQTTLEKSSVSATGADDDPSESVVESTSVTAAAPSPLDISQVSSPPHRKSTRSTSSPAAGPFICGVSHTSPWYVLSLLRAAGQLPRLPCSHGRGSRRGQGGDLLSFSCRRKRSDENNTQPTSHPPPEEADVIQESSLPPPSSCLQGGDEAITTASRSSSCEEEGQSLRQRLEESSKGEGSRPSSSEASFPAASENQDTSGASSSFPSVRRIGRRKRWDHRNLVLPGQYARRQNQGDTESSETASLRQSGGTSALSQGVEDTSLVLKNNVSSSSSTPSLSSGSSSSSSSPVSAALSPLPPRFPILPALPLFRRPAFPGFYQLLHVPDHEVFEALVRQKKSGVPGGDYVGGFLTVEEKDHDAEEDEEEGPGAKLRKDAGRVSDISELHTTGTLLHILNFAPHTTVKGGQVVVMPYRRIRIIGPAEPEGTSEGEDTSTAPSPVQSKATTGESKEVERNAEVEISEATSPATSSTDSPPSSPTLASTPSFSVEEQAKTDGKKSENDSTTRDNHQSSKTVAPPSRRSNRLSVSRKRSSNKVSRQEPGSDVNNRVVTGSVISAGGSETPSSSATISLPSTTEPSSSLLSEGMGENGNKKTGGYELMRVRVVYLPDEKAGRFDVNDTYKALHLEIIATMKELLKSSYFYKEHFDQVVRFYNLDYPHKLADLVAGMSFAKRHELQAVLAEENIEKRLTLVLEIAKKDLEFAKLQAQVKTQVEEKMGKMQRKFLLTEQLKFLKKELGDVKDDKESILESFRETLEKKKDAMPEEVQKAVTHELSKMHALEQSSSEFSITRTYTEWLVNLPWGDYTADCSDIFEAEKILNEDHYGLTDVKDRILEFIAVTILKKDVQGKIICLVGPPGVGKTSVGQSIARALSRKFYRISLGGMCDVAELRGHRRTYIGALPGKVIQALKECQSMNPVILLDEIDKLGRDFRGDPSSALLEVLDPSQNKSFRDYYLDVPVDLSKVLFVCTANTPDVIPGPLLDRMEVIRIAGYIFQEKLSIAQNYLLPQTQKAAGLTDDQIAVAPEVLEKLVSDYAREAGVRSLLKLIEKIYRKAALALVRKEHEKVEVGLENLTKFVGQPVFQSARLYDETPPGVVMGLAWTQLGGATLYVEAIGRRTSASRYSRHRLTPSEKRRTDNGENEDADEGEEEEDDSTDQRRRGGRGGRRSREITGGEAGGRLKVTGQLGAVMSESSEIALTFCRVFVRLIDPDNNFLESSYIHLHVPEGATPKDGPSAGVTMATALVSLALDRPVLPNVAMTGELTLTGKVLKIGGVKEKVIAARRENVTTLIFPKGNEKDFDELPDYIKEGLDVHFASTYDDVYRVAFGEEPSVNGESRNGVRGGLV
ncbi:lon protease family protein [Cystoisospora suis]|uniref:Lon protease homolog n=1 Tax=Cystoisospora suis TaxID=483139 RepID=A0A2C6KL14_9APIC|nr:lon protease family protein [Cystoisospora suis]